MKKILLITYYWPPAGGAGVIRWLTLSHKLQMQGWSVTVITTKDGDYPVIDNSLEQLILPELKVIRTKTPVFGKVIKKFYRKKESIPYGSMNWLKSDSLAKKISLWIRLNLLIPDARMMWNKYAKKAAENAFLTQPFDWLITSGPPHSTHLIGNQLKQKFPSVKWLADFRDPWTNIGYYQNVKRAKLTYKLDYRLEQKVIHSCDLLLACAGKIVEDFGRKPYMFTLTNSFDKCNYNHERYKPNQEFVISHFGQITAETDFSYLLDLIKQIIKNNLQIRFEFYGNVADEIKKQFVEIPIVSFFSYLPRNVFFEKMVSSEMLLLIMNEVRAGINPLKLFEYMGSLRPILGIGTQTSEPAKIIAQTKSGKMFESNSIEEILKWIMQFYKKWQNQELFFNSSEEIESYEIKHQTLKLMELIYSFSAK
jgi:glycosyltransferase involved in cell wall biosynthesis